MMQLELEKKSSK